MTYPNNPFGGGKDRQQSIQEIREALAAREAVRASMERDQPKLTPEQDEQAKKLAKQLVDQLRASVDKKKTATKPTLVTVVRADPDLQEMLIMIGGNLLGLYFATKMLAKRMDMSKREALGWIWLVRLVLLPMQSDSHKLWTRKV